MLCHVQDALAQGSMGLSSEPQKAQKGPLCPTPVRVVTWYVGPAASIAFICLHADECPSATSLSKKPKLSPPGRHNGKTTETFSFQLLAAWS